jgi:hypothetical protein
MFFDVLGPSHNGRTFRHQRLKGKQNTSGEILATYWWNPRSLAAPESMSVGDGSGHACSPAITFSAERFGECTALIQRRGGNCRAEFAGTGLHRFIKNVFR